MENTHLNFESYFAE